MKLRALFSALALPLITLNAYALSVGEMTVNSNLGEPLALSINVSAKSKVELDSLEVGLAPRVAFKQGGVPYPENADNLQFSLDLATAGNATLNVSTLNTLDTPYLHLLIQLNWSGGKMLREYVVLIDPAGYGETAQTQAIAVSEAVLKSNHLAAVVNKSGDIVTVKRGDSISAIARRYRPADVSAQQAWVAFYNLNKGAFSANNINLLQRGARLTIPTREQMLALSQTAAIKEVRVLSPVSTKPAVTPVATQNSTTQGVLTIGAQSVALSSAEVGGVNSAAVEQMLEGDFGEMASIKEDLNKFGEAMVAVRSENKVVTERLSQIESQLSRISQLLEMQSQILATLNEQVRLQAQSIADAEVQAQAEAQAEAETQAQAQAAESAEASQQQQSTEVQALQDSTVVPAVSDDWIGAVVSAKNKLVDSLKSSVEKLGDSPLFDGLPEILKKWGLYIVAGILALIGLGRFMRRRSEHEIDEEFEQFDDDIEADLERSLADENSEFSSTLGESSVFSMSDESLMQDDMLSEPAGGDSSLFAVDEQDSMMEEMESEAVSIAQQSTIEQVIDVDPLTEAEVYLAYDRKEQAIKVLKEAYATHPKDQNVAVKLLSLYQGIDDVDSFDKVLETAFANRAEDAEEDQWPKIEAIGRNYSPGHALFLDNDFDSPIPVLDIDLQNVDKDDDALMDLSDLTGAAEGNIAATIAAEAGVKNSNTDVALEDLEDVEENPTGSDSFSLDMDSELNDAVKEINQHDPDTSLALAKAYIELGEQEIAKDFLTDVIDTGSAKLKAEARSLLTGLA